jgi:hypothetical protein
LEVTRRDKSPGERSNGAASLFTLYSNR